VGAGEPLAFTRQDDRRIRRMVASLERACGVRLSVYIGTTPGESRLFARRLLGVLGRQAAYGMVIAVDPVARTVEIVTGPRAATQFDAAACAQVVEAMTAILPRSLAAGIAAGLQALATYAPGPALLSFDP